MTRSPSEPLRLGGRSTARRWWQAPRYVDEELDRAGRVVHALGLGIAIISVPILLHQLLLGNWAAIAVLLFEDLMVGVSLVLNRRSSPRTAARLLGVSSLAFAASLQFVSPHGVHDVVTMVYPAVIVLAGALLDTRGFVGMTLLAMGTLAVQYALEVGGWIEKPLSRFAEWRFLLDMEVILAISALTTHLLIRSLRESIARTKRRVAALAESEALYRTLFESATEAVMVADLADGRLVDVNQRAVLLFGIPESELLKRSWTSLAGEAEAAERLLRELRESPGQSPAPVEWRVRCGDETELWIDGVGRRVLLDGVERALFSLRDVTEKRRAAAKSARLSAVLGQAENLASLGRLAGGVAHDFNNLLMCMGGNADVARLRSPDLPQVVPYLEEIGQAVRRASELTERLLALSRRQRIEPRVVDVRQFLESSKRILTRLLGETFELSCTVADDTRPLFVDPQQLEQMIMNLVVNARDATKNQAGSIRLEAANVEGPGGVADLWVRLRVVDGGSGIAPELLPRIFDPFFTTKPVGTGTGLGLSMVLGAAEQNGGRVEVSSSLGVGTSVDILLPAWVPESAVAVKGSVCADSHP